MVPWLDASPWKVPPEMVPRLVVQLPAVPPLNSADLLIKRPGCNALAAPGSEEGCRVKVPSYKNKTVEFAE